MNNNIHGADPTLPRSPSGKIMDGPISIADSVNLRQQIQGMLRSVVELQSQITETKSSVLVAQADATKANNRLDTAIVQQSTISALQSSVARIVAALEKAGISLDSE